MNISELGEVFKLFGSGFLVGLPLIAIFFLIGHVANFLLDIIRKS